MAFDEFSVKKVNFIIKISIIFHKFFKYRPDTYISYNMREMISGKSKKFNPIQFD